MSNQLSLPESRSSVFCASVGEANFCIGADPSHERIRDGDFLVDIEAFAEAFGTDVR